MLLTLCASLASGSSTVLVSGGTLAWEGADGARPYVPVAVNVSNASGLSEEEVLRSVVKALQSWQEASGHAFDFDVWTGVDTAVYPTGQRADGYTTLSFTSNDPGDALADTVAGHTALFYDRTGKVLEGDILLNDLAFRLTRDPTQTNYTDASWTPRTLYLDDVVAHEVGHLLGLGHTGVSTATMFAGAWAGQSTLGCDDVNGMHELYSPGDGGSVSGRIRIVGVGGVAGLEVYAIGAEARTVRAAGFTDPDGDYVLSGLPADDYLLVASPYGGNPDGLPAQLAENFVQPCAVSRTLFGGGEPVRVDGDDVDASWSAACGGGIALPEDPGTMSDPIAVEALDGGRVALAERVPTDADGTWLLIPDPQGALSLDILSWSLFSPARVEAALYDAQGQPVDARITHPLVEHADAPVLDARIEADGLPPGELLLHLTAVTTSSGAYPGGRSFLDDDSFAVVVGTLGEAGGAAASCAPQVDPAAYEPPRGRPPMSTLERGDDGFGCATGGGPAALLALAPVLLALRRRRR